MWVGRRTRGTRRAPGRRQRLLRRTIPQSAPAWIQDLNRHCAGLAAQHCITTTRLDVQDAMPPLKACQHGSGWRCRHDPQQVSCGTAFVRKAGMRYS